MSPQPSATAEETVYKGIHWRRVRGRVGWFNEERSTWVMWRPGQDAPPRPPGWDRASQAVSRSRPSWRSPYRIVPVVLVIGVLVIALVQVLGPRSGNATRDEAAAATKLVGQCLKPNSSKQFPYAVDSCRDSKATLKVVATVSTAPGTTGTCPADTRALPHYFPGVAHPHLLCLQPLRPQSG
ncbi:MAG: hypothetical protein J2P57_15285 [Acidimicrobiaceae bacterium]|nr:hypothetical protein [Acidimicrobiaceae bacterium]